MEPGEDLVIRLSAAVTLRSALDDFEFNAEQFLPYLERSFSLLFTLLKETEECETKVFTLLFWTVDSSTNVLYVGRFRWTF